MSDNQPTLADFYEFDAQSATKLLQKSRAVQNKSVPGGLRAAAAQSLVESAQGFLDEPLMKISRQRVGEARRAAQGRGRSIGQDA